jgi:preprotein translocase subunit YajC
MAWRLLRIFVPIIVVGTVFYLLIERPQTTTGQLRITSDVKGAEILIDGMRIGAVTDTTLSHVITGHRSVAVHKKGYIADPEVRFADVKQDTLTSVAFHLIERASSQRDSDSTGFLESLREEIPLDLEEIAPSSAPSRRVEPDLADETEPYESTGEEMGHDTALSTFASERPIITTPQNISGASIVVSSNPPGAEIIINGDSTGHQTNYTFHDLLRGTYFVSVRKQGYISKPEIVQIDLSRDFQNELVAFMLSLDESLPSPQLTISTEPIEAGIRVAGKPVGRGQVVLKVGLGKSLVEFEDILGYRTPQPQLVELTPETTSVEIVGHYERLEGKALLAITPARPQSIKGGELRIWIDNELILDKPAQKLDGILIHKLVAGKRLVQVEYQGLVQNTQIDIVDDEVSILTFAVESFLSKKSLRLRVEPVVTLQNWQKRARKLTIIELM